MALCSEMTSGDCLVIARSDGRFDVFKLWAEGARQPIDVDLTDEQSAWQVARARLVPDGGAVYYKDEREPDSSIRPFRPDALAIA